ncbi:glycosyltransferase family 9 protein [Cellulomonas telluris]|uniref:glycosyltransferase family 9 protein n=1 Tax=Cellulomonas telluris TaxID=2306636 RepID=UPI001FEB0F22|nr:glycosyltransferase family 9 protein [Cellulomonas telluris]
MVLPSPSAPLPAVGPLGERFADVRRIAVLRGGGLGDLLFAMPAVEALAHAYPDAEITLLGSPMHAALLTGRPGPVHDVEVLPVAPGVREARGQEEDPAATEDFVRRMRDRRFDLAVQVHGGGRNSNPFLLRLGARHTVGTRTPDAVPLERSLPYVYYQHEMLRALEVVGLTGAPAVVLEPRLAVTDEERDRARRHVGGGDRLVVVHPGATDPRRRWPAERFGDVAAAVAADGAQVLVVGDATDVENAGVVVARAQAGLPPAARGRVASLADRLDLGELAGLLSLADVVVANDSGPRHLARAVGAPTVGIFWFGNAVNAGPLGRSQDRMQMSWTSHCPECGIDCTQVGWTAPRCEHDPSFVAGVEVAPVLEDVRELLGTAAHEAVA